MEKHAIAGGNGGFTAESWRVFQNRLRSYVGKRAHVDDVDDIVGDILLKLVTARTSLETARNPSAWVTRVAANALADHYRKRNREQRAGEALEHVLVLAQAPEQEPDATAAAEVSRCLVPFIKGLPAIYAETLMLTEVGGMTQAEAARRLGLSLSAVKSRIQRGRQKLKQAVSRCCALQLDRRGNIIAYRRYGNRCGTS